MVPHPILPLLLLLLLPLPLPLSLSLLLLPLLPLLPLLIKIIIIIVRNSNTTTPPNTHTHTHTLRLRLRLRQNNLGTIIASMRSMIPFSWLEATAWNNYKSETAGTPGWSVQASPSTTQLRWVSSGRPDPPAFLVDCPITRKERRFRFHLDCLFRKSAMHRTRTVVTASKGKGRGKRIVHGALVLTIHSAIIKEHVEVLSLFRLSTHTHTHTRPLVGYLFGTK